MFFMKSIYQIDTLYLEARQLGVEQNVLKETEKEESFYKVAGPKGLLQKLNPFPRCFSRPLTGFFQSLIHKVSFKYSSYLSLVFR